MTFQYTERFPPAAEIHVTRLHLDWKTRATSIMLHSESTRITYQYVTGKTNAEYEGEQQEGRSE